MNIIANEKKRKSPHKQVIEYWHDEVQRARGIRPIITGKDAKNLKRILDAGIPASTIEQAATYYLQHPSFKLFAPALSTLLSAGVINGILNRKENDPNFWRDINTFLASRGKAPVKKDILTKKLTELRNQLSQKLRLKPAEERGYRY